MKRKILILGCVTLMLTACEKEGCTDQTSLNYDTEAQKDDGSCRYSSVSFYATRHTWNGIPVQKIEVTVEGRTGTVTSAYPAGLSSCSNHGTFAHSLTSSRNVGWTAISTLASGDLIYSQGSVVPDSHRDCIPVNVTQ